MAVMLLDELIKKQDDLGMPDGEFAEELKVSRQLWQFTRTKRVPIGKKVIAGTCRRFPELVPHVLLFLGQSG